MRLFHVACNADVGAIYKVRVGIPMKDDSLHSVTELIVEQVRT